MKLVLALAAIALVCSTTAVGSPTRAPAAPKGLHAFVYRADEPVKVDHTYALMPAFAWNAVQGATRYELQLATSRTFSDATTLYNQTYRAPMASVQLQVPWMTGKPYALWVHVRVIANGRTSAWGAPFGFNTAWQQIPTQEKSPTGLIRWSPIDGATGYDVWYLNGPDNTSIHFTTLTNVADEREYWSLHPAGAGTILWRVRAVRLVKSSSLPNGIAVESHGPYSPMFTTIELDGLGGSADEGDLGSVECRVHPSSAAGASVDAWILVDRDSGRSRRRDELGPLPRVRLQRQAMREPGPGRVRDRQPGLGAAQRRPDALALNGQGRERRSRREVLRLRNPDRNLHGRRLGARSRGVDDCSNRERVGAGGSSRHPLRPPRLQRPQAGRRTRPAPRGSSRCRTTAGPRAATGGPSSPWRSTRSSPTR